MRSPIETAPASGPGAAPKASPWVDRLQRLVIGHDDLGIHRGPDRPISVAPVDSVRGSLVDQVLIVGMTGQPGCHEGAQGHDRLSAGSNVVEGATNQDRAQALALVTRLDLGVDEVITTASEVINGEAGDPPVQLEDIAVVVLVVSYDGIVIVAQLSLFSRCLFRSRPDSRTARVRRNSIWAWTLRNSSAAHFSRAACRSGPA